MRDARSVRFLNMIAAAAIVAFVSPVPAVPADPRPRQLSNVEIRATGTSNAAPSQPSRPSRKWDLTLPYLYIEPAHIVTATGEALSATVHVVNTTRQPFVIAERDVTDHVRVR